MQSVEQLYNDPCHLNQLSCLCESSPLSSRFIYVGVISIIVQGTFKNGSGYSHLQHTVFVCVVMLRTILHWSQ